MSAEPEPEGEVAFSLLEEPARIVFPWTKETVGGASKKELVGWLQTNCPEAFVREHKLFGKLAPIAKKSKAPALLKAYWAWHHLMTYVAPPEPEPEPEVEPVNFFATEEEVAEETLKSAKHATGSDVGWLAKLPSDALANVLRFVGYGDPVARLRIAAVSRLLRKAVLNSAPMVWRSLVCAGCPYAKDITNQAVRGVCNLSKGQLRRLDVSGCKGVSRTAVLNVAKKHPRLEFLRACDVETAWSCEQLIEFVRKITKLCPELKTIEIDLTERKPSAELCKMVAGTVWKDIDVRITGIEFIPPNQTEVERLQAAALLSGEPFTETPALTLPEVVALCEVLRNLDGCPCEKVDLAHNLLSTEMISELVNAIVQGSSVGSKVQILDLRSNGCADECCPLVGLVMCCVEVLDLRFNGINEDGAEALAEALTKDNCTVRDLELSCNTISADGVEFIAEALKTNTSLVNLELNICEVGDDGTMDLAEALSVNKTLQVLGLRGNRITAEACAFLPPCLKLNTTLKKLEMSSNDIGDLGAASLADALKSGCQLEDVNVSKNNITDRGGEALGAALLVNTSITRMEIRQNYLGKSLVYRLSGHVDGRMIHGSRCDAQFQKQKKAKKGKVGKMTKRFM